MPLLIAVLVAFPAVHAHAHLGRISYSEVKVHDDTVSYRLKFAVHLIPGAPSDASVGWTHDDVARSESTLLAWLRSSLRLESNGKACRPSIVDLLGPDRNNDLTVLLAYRCPAAIEDLRVDFHPFDAAVADFQNIVSVAIGETTASYVFTPGNRTLIVGQRSGEQSPSFREFFVLGVEHIWSGYDHLLFLLALFLPGGTVWRIAGIVSAFTIAHSITLSLAALGIVTLPPEPVEVGIAVSIVWVAASGLIEKKDHRWPLTFAFGLIHGFGFAGILRSAGIPSGQLAVPLVAFNLGVEAGQLVVVCASLPLLRLLLRQSYGRGARLLLTTAVIAAGVVWIFQRSAPLLGY